MHLYKQIVVYIKSPMIVKLNGKYTSKDQKAVAVMEISNVAPYIGCIEYMRLCACIVLALCLCF